MMDFKIGTFVKYIVPKDMKKEAFARGRIEGIETFEDVHGVRKYYQIRWFCPNGKPDSTTQRHTKEELDFNDGIA
jgi:hypothetical protein